MTKVHNIHMIVLQETHYCVLLLYVKERWQGDYFRVKLGQLCKNWDSNPKQQKQNSGSPTPRPLPLASSKGFSHHLGISSQSHSPGYFLHPAPRVRAWDLLERAEHSHGASGTGKQTRGSFFLSTWAAEAEDNAWLEGQTSKPVCPWTITNYSVGIIPSQSAS